VVGDGEAETGPLATSWHSNKFLNPIRDGAVLPILNLNGYKIANPTILARISHEELEALFVGYGYTPYFVEGDDPAQVHQQLASTLETAIAEIRAHQARARAANDPYRPRWPMIVLRTPKGWSGPKVVNGHQAEGSWRSHQVPFADVRDNPASLALLDQWMRSYKPDELFDEHGTLRPELKALAPKGSRRMSANPHANGGLLRKPLKLPDFRARRRSAGARRGGAREHQTARRVPARRDQEQPDHLPAVRSRRNRLQPAAGGLRGEQEDLDGRSPSRRRRRRRAGARRPRHGNALRAHPARLARRLSADRPPRPLPHL
jgi:phosphoketolase